MPPSPQPSPVVVNNTNRVDGLGEGNGRGFVQLKIGVVSSSLCLVDRHQFYFVAWRGVGELIARPACMPFSKSGPSLLLIGEWL